MKEHPLLCRDSVVRAILDGRQTQDRRPVKGLGVFVDTQMDLAPPTLEDGRWIWPDGTTIKEKWAKGDVLWVREAIGRVRKRSGDWICRADMPLCVQPSFAWIPSIHMPRRACRLTLEVLDVKIERVQAATDGTAFAEGYPGRNACELGPLAWFVELWDSLYAAKGYEWDKNPWVFATTFRRIEQ